MLTAAIVGACCVGVGAVLMTSAARSAAVTVPVSVGPGGMLVFDPAAVTAHQGDTVKWTWGTKVTVRWACSEAAAGFVEDVQQQKPGAAGFTALVTGSTAQSKVITLARARGTSGRGTRNSATGKASGYCSPRGVTAAMQPCNGPTVRTGLRALLGRRERSGTGS